MDNINQKIRIAIDENNGVVISLRDYAEAAEKAFKKVKEWRKHGN